MAAIFAIFYTNDLRETKVKLVSCDISLLDEKVDSYVKLIKADSSKIDAIGFIYSGSLNKIKERLLISKGIEPSKRLKRVGLLPYSPCNHLITTEKALVDRLLMARSGHQLMNREEYLIFLEAKHYGENSSSESDSVS